MYYRSAKKKTGRGNMSRSKQKDCVFNPTGCSQVVKAGAELGRIN